MSFARIHLKGCYGFIFPLKYQNRTYVESRHKRGADWEFKKNNK